MRAVRLRRLFSKSLKASNAAAPACFIGPDSITGVGKRETMWEMNIQGAYAELRVLDLGQGVAAPYCAMLLAMHGAEVIKLEPLAGDWSRGLGMRYGDHTAMSAHYNRGKRSLALDLKAPAGREIASSLAA